MPESTTRSPGARARRTAAEEPAGARRSAAEAKAEANADADVKAEGHPICTVAFCPFCLAVTAAGQMRPDVMQHLLEAGREFFLAARAMIDARADDLSEKRDPAEVERIDIS
jgi:hypothetical protein